MPSLAEFRMVVTHPIRAVLSPVSRKDVVGALFVSANSCKGMAPIGLSRNRVSGA